MTDTTNHCPACKQRERVIDELVKAAASLLTRLRTSNSREEHEARLALKDAVSKAKE